MIDTKPCPGCGAKMIKWETGQVFASYPPQYPWNWRCGCGHIEKGGVTVGKTAEDLFQEEWNRQQGIV